MVTAKQGESTWFTHTGATNHVTPSPFILIMWVMIALLLAMVKVFPSLTVVHLSVFLMVTLFHDIISYTCHRSLKIYCPFLNLSKIMIVTLFLYHLVSM